MKKLLDVYLNGYLKNDKMNKLFKNYSLWFRVLFLFSGPIATIRIILLFFPESILFDILIIFYLIVTFLTFFIETIIHGIKYIKNGK